MSDTGSGAAPAGWYEDGVTAGQERYWDGTQWTDQFRPLAPPPPPAPEPAAPAAPEAPAQQPAEAPAQQPIAAPAQQPAAAAAPPATTQPPAGYAPPTGAPAAMPAYPAYQPAQAAPRAPRKGLSTGAIVGIVVGAVVVVVAAIVLILGFTAWGWGGGGGGGTSNVQQQQFLSDVKSSGDVSASDAALLDAGNKLCDAGRTIVAGDYLGGMTKYLDVFSAELDLVTLGNVAMYAMTDLCPDVQRQLEELGQSFL